MPQTAQRSKLKPTMSHQIPLKLERPESYGLTDLIVSETNQGLIDLLRTPKDWINPHLILIGPSGSGKTHLGHIFADINHGQFLSALETQYMEPSSLPECAVAVDDAEQADEELLFHLFNHSLQTAQPLVLLSKTHPLNWQTTLPDLASRLKAMRGVDIPEPDEAILSGVLKKLFAHHAITPSADFFDYISRRMERSVPKAQKIVTEIEDYANGRAFTRTLAKDFLEKSENLSWLTDQDDF